MTQTAPSPSRKISGRIVGSCITIAGLLWSGTVLADRGAHPSQICDQAAVRAAQFTGVPRKVLLAISRVESGRTVAGSFGPWPWTMNKAGKGAWFDTAAEAVAYARQAVAKGDTNIDIGCFQINYRWHGAEFPDLDAMFDPDQNALYAARYLQSHFARTGDWEGAIGAYHSRQETAAAGYLQKVTALIGEGLPDPPPQIRVVGKANTNRDNRFPLLRQGAGQSAGSLVATRNVTASTSLLR